MLPGVLVKTKLLCMKGPRAQREKDSWTDMFLLPLTGLLPNPLLTGSLGEAKLGYGREIGDSHPVPGTALGTGRCPRGQLDACTFL